MPTIKEVRNFGQTLKNVLNLDGYPVGVRFLTDDISVNDAIPAEGHRYCQAAMKARHGQHMLVNADTISCPAAARAFGFRQLPEKLKSGKGLVKFGITNVDSVGKSMFENMPTLEMGQIKSIDLFPLNMAEDIPDIVFVEDKVEKLMWILLGYMHSIGGKRVESSTVVLQAICVDSTIIPYINNSMNFSYGCYGCRDATDIGPGEASLGFPVNYLPEITEHVKYLGEKAIPHSREKNALRTLQEKDNQSTSCESK
ncbi:DUF169 domain-containing protein [Methanohalobium sp.]|uniref:DUF169 domain-containing protein n=1 Tax=Methanohalobium sp. TaxID=2837493 RepID=UPI0025F5ACF2|nr:DUF169 domain-containing protein [Methanohalobium sp.]